MKTSLFLLLTLLFTASISSADELEELSRDLDTALEKQQYEQLEKHWNQLQDRFGNQEGITLLKKFVASDDSRSVSRFAAAMMVAETGTLSRIGPRKLWNTNLEAMELYLKNSGLLRKDAGRIKIDDEIASLKVSATIEAMENPPVQFLLWKVIVDYQLSFRLSDRNEIVIYRPALKP